MVSEIPLSAYVHRWQSPLGALSNRDRCGGLYQPNQANQQHRKLNKSPTTVEDPAFLALPLCIPKVKKITLHFPLGLEVSARNMKGVTIKDALDAIHKQFKKRVRRPFRSIPAHVSVIAALPHFTPHLNTKMSGPSLVALLTSINSKMMSSRSPT